MYCWGQNKDTIATVKVKANLWDAVGNVVEDRGVVIDIQHIYADGSGDK